MVELVVLSIPSLAKYTKHKIDTLEVENFYYKYTLIESGIKFDKIDFIVYEVKCTSIDGGCVCKMSNDCHVKEGAELKEDEIKQGKDRAMGLFKTVVEYLLVKSMFVLKLSF
ncbi:major strawberry allergen Fra a 1-3-like [Eucalyptus grandis]|uniref:major strawberry allergen Fra a 1-3-like n=1 Tax=Eucalyptus grandis TaxID=71139 RepID=UPI00192EC43A|nr:major strawberry allergen Fra a 1-3-like [Eucalyptus grandis]